MSRVDVYSLLFRPALVPKDDFAGRGVGMDVVRTSLGKIQGATIDSTLGRNNLRLPLTLSICKALLRE